MPSAPVMVTVFVLTVPAMWNGLFALFFILLFILQLMCSRKYPQNFGGGVTAL
jgi:hypothetical protein